MARLSLVAVSAGSGLVLFVGTSLGLLAAQGRLGSLLGSKPPAIEDSTGGQAPGPGGAGHAADSGPAAASKGAPAAGPSAPGAATAEPAAAAGSPAKNAVAGPDGGHAASSPSPASAAHGDSGRSAPAAPKSGVKPPSAPPPAPRRVATASIVQHFRLPEPFTGAELESLVHALQETHDAHGALTEELAVQKAANERDRIDIEARARELDELRKKLEQQKSEVTAKVAELSKRNDQLSAGEEKYVKATVARLATLKLEEAKAQLLLEDDALAARILHKMDPKLCAKLLVSLPAEKSVVLTRLLRSISLAEAGAGTAGEPNPVKK